MSRNPKAGGLAKRGMCCLTMAVATIGSTACSSMQSRRVDAGQNNEPPTPGMTYYLPMRFAEVTFERVLVANAPTQTIKQAQDALASARATAASAANAFESTEARLVAIRAAGIPATTATYQEAAVRAVDAKLARDEAAAAVNDAHAGLRKSIADHQAWDAARSQCGYRDRFTITLQKPVADVNAKFVAELVHYPTRNDAWVLETTPGGLLSTVEGTIEDQSAEILVALARSAAAIDSSILAANDVSIRTFAITGAQPVVPGIDPSCRFDWKPVLIQRVIDPAKPQSWKDLFTEINQAATVACRNGQPTPCGPRVFSYAIDDQGLPKQAKAGIEFEQPMPGIFYRRELPLQIRITESSGGNAQDAGTFLLMLPNHSAADFMPIEASPFVTSTHELGFDNGILVSLDSARPSELLRVAALPWDVASATIGALSQLVQLRVNYTTQSASLVEQQVALLTQLSAQIEAQRRLEAIRGGTSSEQAPSTETSPDER